MLKKQQESICIIISPVVTRGYGKQGTYTASSWHFGDQDRACSALGLLCDCSTCDVEEGLLSQVGSTQWYCFAVWATTITLEDLGCWSCKAWSWPSSCYVSPTCSSYCRAVPSFFSFFSLFLPMLLFLLIVKVSVDAKHATMTFLLLECRYAFYHSPWTGQLSAWPTSVWDNTGFIFKRVPVLSVLNKN